MGEPARLPVHEQGQATLLATKLFVPRVRGSLVARPRLVNRLGDPIQRPLTLVCAPAGYGKTTLVVEWLSHLEQPIAWLSLDSADDDPQTFLSYLVAALQSAAPEVGRSVDALLRSPQLPPLESILTLLLNDLAALSHELTLVLEDYHFVANHAIHSGVSYLLDHLPPSVHLVIATRADPPLPLARLRSRGELVEVRADDLRFEPDEARSLLEQTAGVRLTSEESTALQARTEGWAVGLQLAALSLRGRRGKEDVSRFVEDFAGSHRYVADYLLEEVLGRQPEEVQEFLLQTSILDRLSGPLVEAVTERAEGQATLERLETENLFLVPLDDERCWYRYHHIFADLLRSRLLRSDREAAHGLHRRAARWLDREGFANEAVGHALAAEDSNLAAQLVVRYWWPVTAGGQTTTTYRWLSCLPDEAVRAHPWLAFASAWLCYIAGRFGEVESYLDAAARELGRPGADEVVELGGITRAGLLGAIPALRSHLAVLRGDVARALALAHESIELTPKGAPLGMAHAYGALAIALEAKPDSAGAIAAMETALPLFREVRNSLAVADYTYYLARLLIRRGELSRAEATCRQVLRLAEDEGLGTLPPYRLVHTALALVFLARGEAGTAERELRLGLELDCGGSSFEEEKDTFLALARLQLLREDVEGALDTLQEAAEVVSRSGSQLGAGEVEAWHAVVLLRSSEMEEASKWAERAATRGGDDRGYPREVETLARARVLIAERREAEAIELLDSLLAEAEGDGRVGSQIDTLVIRALAQRARGRVEQALGDLRRAVALAEPEGYTQPFLDDGEALAEPLRRGAAEHRWTAPLDEFVARLLAEFQLSARRPAREIPLPTPPPARHGPPTQPLVEPLSERELEVLALMADGLTNEQIGSRLIIALGTVKAHIHNISGKLGASNRAQAVARAKELDLL